MLGALGLGVRDPGQVAYVAGTSNVIMGVSGELVLDPWHRFLVTPLAEPGRWGLEMDLLATGSAVTWLAGLLGGELDAAGLVALAAGLDPALAPVVLPYLSPGEQGALWDPRLHGAVVGLHLGHGRQHLARGLVNGIVLESRRCLAVLDETGGFGRTLAVAGGSAADQRFRADLADASRRLVSMPRRRCHGLLGARRRTAGGQGQRRPVAAGRVPVVRRGRRAGREPGQGLGRAVGHVRVRPSGRLPPRPRLLVSGRHARSWMSRCQQPRDVVCAR